MTVKELIEVLEQVENKESVLNLYDTFGGERHMIDNIDLSMGDSLVDINFTSEVE